MNLISSQKDFLSFIKDQVVSGCNLSIRGVARCCGVNHESVIEAGDFASVKLGQKLTEQGFEAGDLVESGFPPQAVWIVVEYFAYESKAKAPMAKQLARTFGSLGIVTTLNALVEQEPVRALPPKRDTVDWVECSKYISNLNDPILKSYLTQSLYEDLAVKAIAAGEDRHIPIAVLAREMGYTLKPGQDAAIGKFAVKYLQPTGKAPHGRYTVNTYIDNQRTREVVDAFFN